MNKIIIDFNRLHKQEYMMPSTMVVNIQAANQLLTASNDLTLHNETSDNDSYVREEKWSDDEWE